MTSDVWNTKKQKKNKHKTLIELLQTGKGFQVIFIQFKKKNKIKKKMYTDFQHGPVNLSQSVLLSAAHLQRADCLPVLFGT